MTNGDVMKHKGVDLIFKTKMVYFFAGQSNMGLTQVTTIPGDSSKYSGLISGVRIYNPSYASRWEQLNVGKNTCLDPNRTNFINGFGPEASFGYNMQRKFGPNIYIIKEGSSNTALYNDWSFGGSQYNIFVPALTDALDSLLKMGYRIDIKGFVWMQGESDATTEGHANNYNSNLNTFFHKINKEIDSVYLTYGIKTDTTYIKIIGRIGTTEYDYTNTIRYNQEAFVGRHSDSYLIDTDNYPMGSAPHFSALGQLQFGWDCYQILKNK